MHSGLCSVICQNLYAYFHSEDQLGSLYHVGSLVNFLLTERNNETLIYLITYNLLWSFIQELSNPVIFDVVFCLVNPLVQRY